MVLENFINNTMAGIDNPECAFFVGNMVGTASIGFIAFRLALIYYGIKLLDKLIFKGIPRFYDWAKFEIKLRRFRR